MRTLHAIALTLLVIGGINWGLIGFFQFDLVAAIFGGQTSLLSRIIYGLVGISAVYYVATLFTGEEVEDNTVNNGRVNYGTEFAEENDFENDIDDDLEDR
ncbi:MULTISPECIES: DUF378 domain-containing protein [Oceanobacillus]|uniref:DUF378 domain-containing protein n=1 Tax=Oceanobacillus kimchii TaxID=746691 RepID=A0ABQ5TMY9_9BACI|nr:MULTISPECIES: DUF378 domain-containing protein [Oceanobacillus]MBT2600717.1 DUF378 domain-containing protein [Oceanobacillus sp. ISL-74]MBT2650886.1 DUF378 domain-containing protein [Oceanobacillus sp. ISL-73]MCT1575472.1 DUF378 domain-containing protein [Oceanobacillus kimchii]MCT2138045.1 DUF378 domain-containing protein [Oceanobacillus kimchii]OEH55289.1 DUF378 domain-containing protein [Oceanobacillus sp. E9]